GSGDGAFEAAAAPTRARLAADVDDDVPDLTGGETVADVEATVDQEAGADTLSNLDDEQAAARRLAEGVLAEGGGVGIVHHVGRHTEAIGDARRQRQLEPP